MPGGEHEHRRLAHHTADGQDAAAEGKVFVDKQDRAAIIGHTSVLTPVWPFCRGAILALLGIVMLAVNYL